MPILPLGAAAALGIAPFIGSFIGVLIRRLPENRPVGFSRSACDHCGVALGPLDLFPLLSYAALRGRCRHCGAAIDRFYPAVELAAVAVAISAVIFAPADEVLIDCGLGWALLALAWIDARTYLLPDALTLPLILCGVAQGWFWDRDALSPLIGAAAGFLSIWLLAAAYRRFRGRDGIGLGDAKLLAAAGAWLGWRSLPETLLLASLCGIAAIGGAHIFGRKARADTVIPFGPFLALAIWAARLLGPIAS